MSMKHAVVIFGVLALTPSLALAQGTIRGAAEGADQGAAVAGPVGGVVGGAVGAATGTVGGVLGVGGDRPCGTRSVTRTDDAGNSETRTSSNCP
jgi:hypothetical protein